MRITTQAGGEIVAVNVKTNDKVAEGDVMVRLDDTDLVDKLAAARAEALVRVRERDEEPAAKGAAEERRVAEDQLDKADRALFDVRSALDAATLKARADGTPDALTKSREARRGDQEGRHRTGKPGARERACRHSVADAS